MTGNLQITRRITGTHLDALETCDHRRAGFIYLFIYVSLTLATVRLWRGLQN
jgi:hypothetical protein